MLENHHIAAAWQLFFSHPDFNWLNNVSEKEFNRFRYLVTECVQATDLKDHNNVIDTFASLVCKQRI